MAFKLLAGTRSIQLGAVIGDDVAFETELYGRWLTRWPFEAVPAVVNGTAGTHTASVTGGKLNVTQIAAGANQLYGAVLLQTALVYGSVISGGNAGLLTRVNQVWRKRVRIGALLNVTNVGTGTGDQQEMGISLSYPNINIPPWPQPPQGPDGAGARLCYRPKTNDFALKVHRGSTQPEIVIPLTGITVPNTATAGFFLELVNDPFIDTITAMVDGVIGATAKGTQYPRWDFELNDNNTWFMLYSISGENALSRNICNFGQAYHDLKDPHGVLSPTHP